MRILSSLPVVLALVATAAQAVPQTAPRPVAHTSSAPSPTLVAQCRALALEMVEQVQTAPLGPAMTQPQRAANAAMTVAATAARVAGGAAGALTAEILNATAAEAQAAAEEAQMAALDGVAERLDAIETRMTAAGCTDAVFDMEPSQ